MWRGGSFCTRHLAQCLDISLVLPRQRPANLLVVLLRVSQYNVARGESREILPRAGPTHQGTEAGTEAQSGGYDFLRLLG